MQVVRFWSGGWNTSRRMQEPERLSCVFCCAAGGADELQHYITCRGLWSAVEAATGSELTHMGVVTLVAGEPHVYEASGPVGLTPVDEWIARGVEQRFWVRRLRERERLLSPETLERMHAVARSFAGRPYDRYFQWGARRLYCSELVYNIYLVGAGLSLGQVQQLGELDLSSKVVKRLIKERFHRQLKRPLDTQELVITPVAIFNDQRLESVWPP